MTWTCAKVSTSSSTGPPNLACCRICALPDPTHSTYSLALQRPRVFPCSGYDSTRASIEAIHGGEGTEELALPPPLTVGAMGTGKIKPIPRTSESSRSTCFPVLQMPCDFHGQVPPVSRLRGEEREERGGGEGSRETGERRERERESTTRSGQGRAAGAGWERGVSKKNARSFLKQRPVFRIFPPSRRNKI